MNVYTMMKTATNFKVGFGKEDIEFILEFKCPKEYANPKEVEDVKTDCKEDISEVLKIACRLYNHYGTFLEKDIWNYISIPEKYIQGLLNNCMSCISYGKTILEDELTLGEEFFLEDLDEDFQELCSMFIEEALQRNPSAYCDGNVNTESLEFFNYLKCDTFEDVFNFAKSLNKEIDYNLIVHCGTATEMDIVHDVFYDFCNKTFYKRIVDFSSGDVFYEKLDFVSFDTCLWKE